MKKINEMEIKEIIFYVFCLGAIFKLGSLLITKIFYGISNFFSYSFKHLFRGDYNLYIYLIIALGIGIKIISVVNKKDLEYKREGMIKNILKLLDINRNRLEKVLEVYDFETDLGNISKDKVISLLNKLNNEFKNKESYYNKETHKLNELLESLKKIDTNTFFLEEHIRTEFHDGNENS